MDGAHAATHCTRCTEIGTQLDTYGQMLQGSQDLLVLSHVEQVDGVHGAIAGGRSDAACRACLLLSRESRAEPVELLGQPLSLGRLDCNGGFGKLEPQLGHDLRSRISGHATIRDQNTASAPADVDGSARTALCR